MSNSKSLSKKEKDFLRRIKNLTKEEFEQSLYDAGIITKSGKLRKPYR
jgi:hypothetical protein